MASRINLDSANPLLGAKVVDDAGTIQGLDDYKGETVYVVRAPRIQVPGDAQERLQKAFETPKLFAQELLGYVRAHRDLSLTQYRQFTEKYGAPQDLVREYAKRAGAEDLQGKVKEFQSLVQTRLDETAKEINQRYEKLETEFDAALERLFKVKGAEAGSAAEAGANGEAKPEPIVTVIPDTVTDATPRKAGKKAPSTTESA